MYTSEKDFLDLIVGLLRDIEFKSRKDKQQVKKVIKSIEERINEISRK